MKNNSFINCLKIFKGIYSSLLLVFSIVLIMGLIGNKQTNLSSYAHPAIAYILLWAAILWLTMVEGGQASLVGLEPVDNQLYKESHPKAFKCTSITNNGDNLDKYLLGRQFMVVLVVFCVNLSGGPVEGVSLWNFPRWVTDIMFQGGLAMIMLTCNVGQLMSQVNASLCMLDYTNNYFALLTLYVAMAIEFSGLLHASYLIQMLVNLLAGKKTDSKEQSRNSSIVQKIFFFVRCLISLAILSFSLGVTMEALFNGKTTMWSGIPAWVAVIIFVILLCVVGMLEGMQIAFFAVAKIPASERGDSMFAKRTCELLFRGEGYNMPAFMVGRQLCVVSCMFFVARVTTVSIPEGGDNIFNVPHGLQKFFNLGFLGALITTIIGSISWQLVAATFPIAFLSNPLTYILLRICLLLEGTGLCQASWVMAAVHKKIANFQRDEIYIGTAEERASKKIENNDTV